VHFGKPRQRPHLSYEFLADTSDCVSDTHHQRGVDDILARQTTMQPPRGWLGRAGAQERYQCADRIAVDIGIARDRFDVVVGHMCAEIGPRRLRGDPGIDERIQPRLFDRDHRTQEGAVAHQIIGTMITWPEQIAHDRCPG
jgi:hypothetical protein